MAKKLKILLITCLFVIGYLVLFFLGRYWVTIPRHPKPSLEEFSDRFQQGKIFFEAINQEVDIGHDNYFRDDGAVNNLDEHSRKLRFEMAALLPLEEIDKIVPGHSDYVDGLSFGIHLGGKTFIIIFYKGKGKSETQIFAEKVHEQTHALIRLGKIDLVKNFLKNNNIPVEYNQEELFKLCGLDPKQKHHMKIFHETISNKEAAIYELLAQKIQKFHQHPNNSGIRNYKTVIP